MTEVDRGVWILTNHLTFSPDPTLGDQKTKKLKDKFKKSLKSFYKLYKTVENMVTIPNNNVQCARRPIKRNNIKEFRKYRNSDAFLNILGCRNSIYNYTLFYQVLNLPQQITIRKYLIGVMFAENTKSRKKCEHWKSTRNILNPVIF